MDASWEHYLNSVRQFREEAGERITEIEERLSTLNSIGEHLNAVELLMTGQPEQDRQQIEPVRAACDMILYGDYVHVTNRAVAVSMVSRKIEEDEPNIPATMQPKVREIKGYFEKIKAKSEEIEDLIREMKKKIRETGKKDYKISQTEATDLKMDMLDLEEGLKICSDYLSQADKVIEMFTSDVTTHLIKEGLFCLAGGAMVYMGAAQVASKAAELVVKGKDMITKAGTAAGVSFALYNLYSFKKKYDLLITKNEEISSELRDLKIVRDEKDTKVTKVKERKDLLGNENVQ
ncbi:uncharacterized protein LOC144649254 [Oculina patagonica]